MYNLIEKYEPENKNFPRISTVIMVKNEHLRIEVTLESVKEWTSCYIILDTGSEDNTIDIIINYCKKNKKPLYMIQSKFEGDPLDFDFSKYRNILLDYADTIPCDYHLLLDCNDELRGGSELIEFAKKELKTSPTAYLMCQEWKTGTTNKGTNNEQDCITKYFNVRFLKTKKGWRYKYPIHEYIENKNGELVNRCIPDNVILFQDRTQDDDKSSKRFYRDKEIFHRLLKKDPNNPRNVFYLAQTYGCINEFQNCYKYYKLRVTLEGFWEERFLAYLRLGDMGLFLEKKWKTIQNWYFKAFEICPRAEPLMRLAKYYDGKSWELAFQFSKIMCELKYPSDCVLFVDKECYNYERYHKLGIYAYYAYQYEIGKHACLKAIEIKNLDIDKDNLKHYINKEKEGIKSLSKNEYFKLRLNTIKKENPKLTANQIASKIKNEWKQIQISKNYI